MSIDIKKFEQLELFSVLETPVFKEVNEMVTVFGKGPLHKRCKDCMHLIEFRGYKKCDRRRLSGGLVTDHGSYWTSCARFEDKEWAR